MLTHSFTASELAERLEVMKKQEMQHYYRCSDYLQKLPLDPHTVDEFCRTKMVEWCFQVVDYIKLSRETVYVAISYLDRFMSSNTEKARLVLCDRSNYQLAVMTCLYTAVKLLEPKIITLSVLTELSRGCYTPDDFERMEKDVLTGLQWHMNAPTALSFLEHYFAQISSENPEIRFRCDFLDNAKYQIELSVTDYSLMTHNKSDIAIAAMINNTQIMAISDRDIVINSIKQVSAKSLKSQSLLLTMGKLQYNYQMQSIPQRRITYASQSNQRNVQTKRKSLPGTVHSPTCISTSQPSSA